MVFGTIWEEFMSPKRHDLVAPDVKTTTFDGDKTRRARPPMGCSFRTANIPANRRVIE
jgi:hypothetical protein